MRKASFIVLCAGVITAAILMVPHEIYAGFLPRVTPAPTYRGGTGGYDYNYNNKTTVYSPPANYSNYYYSAYTQGGRRYSCYYE